MLGIGSCGEGSVASLDLWNPHDICTVELQYCYSETGRWELENAQEPTAYLVWVLPF